jgi:hypothetical protein
MHPQLAFLSVVLQSQALDELSATLDKFFATSEFRKNGESLCWLTCVPSGIACACFFVVLPAVMPWLLHQRVTTSRPLGS